MSEYVETSEKDMELLRTFSNNKYIQKSVKLFKDKYKEKYGFSNAKINTERLFPVKDPLNMSYKELYDMFCDIYDNKCKPFLLREKSKNKLKNKIKTIFDTEFVYKRDTNKENCLLMNSHKLPNFLQMRKYSEYLCDDIPYLINQDLYMNAYPVLDLNDYFDNFDFGYVNALNPNLNLVKNECNDYLKNEFDPFKILNSMYDILNEYSKYKKNMTFLNIFFDEFIDWCIDKFDDVKVDEIKRSSIQSKSWDTLKYNFDIDGFVKVFEEYEGKINLTKDLVISIIRDFFKIFPFYNSVLYKNLIGSPIAVIFFMAFNIMLIKRLYKDNIKVEYTENFIYAEKVENNKKINFKEIFDLSLDGISKEKINIDISEKFDQKYFVENLHILKNEFSLILKSLYGTEFGIDNTYIGKKSFSFGNVDTSGELFSALTSLIELFAKFDNIKWFDFSIFEVDVNEENKKVLSEFSECLLESVLIYKNSLILSDTSSFEISNHFEDKILYKPKKGYFLRRPDITASASKTNYPFKTPRDTVNPDNVFASINVMISLANSINICVENYNEKGLVEILTNSQMKRNGVFTDLYVKYSKLFVYETKKYISDNSISNYNFSVDTEKEAFLYLSGIDMVYQIKTWYFDSYYFWRTFKKFSKLSNKDESVFVNLFSKYFYDKKIPIDLNIGNKVNISLVPYVVNFATDLLTGIYFYSSIILNISYFYNDIPDNFVLECYSRIIMKDLYIFGDKENNLTSDKYYYIKNYNVGGSDGFLKCPMVIKDRYFQKILNSFKYGTSMFEKMLSDTYIKWFIFGLVPNIDNHIRSMIYELIPSFEYSDNDMKKYIISCEKNRRYFGIDIIKDIISNLNNINNISFLSHLCYCQKFLMLNNTIVKNVNKYHNYSLNNKDISNDNFKNKILGKIIFPIFLNNSERYNIFKSVNILENMVNDRIGNSLDDYDYSSCCGLPLTLFYKNSINMLMENIFTSENLRVDISFIPGWDKSKTILLMYDLMFNFVDLIINVINKENKNYTKEDIISMINGILMTRYKYYNDPELNSNLNEIFNFDKEFFVDSLNICGQYTNFECFVKCIVMSVLQDWDYKQFQKVINENVLNFSKFLKVKNSITQGIGKLEYVDYTDTTISKNDEFNNLKDIKNDDLNNNISDDILKTSINGFEYLVKSKDLNMYVPKWGKNKIKKFKNNINNSEDNICKGFENLIKYLSSKGEYFIVDGFSTKR